VLIGREFIYFGGDGPVIPAAFRNWQGDDVCGKRTYRRHFAEGLAEAVIAWAMDLGSGRQAGGLEPAKPAQGVGGQSN
jgi:hypothetical protein